MKLSFSLGALDEIQEACAWYDRQRAGLAMEFKRDLAAAIRDIRKYPLMWRKRGRTVRLALLHKFPYSIIYRVDADRVIVHAVAHGSRRPGYWKDRI